MSDTRHEGRKDTMVTTSRRRPGRRRRPTPSADPAIATRERRAGSISPSGETPYLEVEDLTVAFPTADGLVSAVQGLSYSACRSAAPWPSSASPARARACRAWP